MGQKTHPIGFRLGVIKTWDSNWYDDKSFAQKLQEDSVIRSYLKKRLEKAGIANITKEYERLKNIYTSGLFDYLIKQTDGVCLTCKIGSTIKTIV